MIDDFKCDLEVLSSKQIFRKYVLNGPCHVLNEELHFRLKEEICEFFDIDFSNVIPVGSARFGFSIKPGKRYVAFGEESDIDIAVVSPDLFTKIWNEAFLYKKSGAFWPQSAKFFRYLSEGWIRPDKLPVGPHFPFTQKWWDFFNSLTSSRQYGPYKIRAGLYHSMFFFEEYQKICIEQCIEEIK